MQYYIWKGFHKSSCKIGMKKSNLAKALNTHTGMHNTVYLRPGKLTVNRDQRETGLYSEKAYPFSMLFLIQQFFK